jgi:hypothetical protein
MGTIASARNEWVRATSELVAARLVVDLEDDFLTTESSDVE